MLFAALSALSLAAAAAAQTPVVIKVGGTTSIPGGVFQYINPDVTAANGTVVSFQFTGVPGNHTVTQSSFSAPCTPLAGGFDSGWVQIGAAVPVTPTFNITITNDSKPIWFFCKQLNPSPHCDDGMVGSINAATTGANTFAAFQAAAKALTGPSGQSVGNLVGIGASASAPVATESGVNLFGQPNSGAAASATGSASAASGSATAPAASGSSSGSAAAPSTSAASGASNVVANSIVAFLAAGLGFVMV
jgi:hypothetical protein